MNRKRSHDDLEDADECLPISKRINSLHLEGKAQGIHHQPHPLNGFGGHGAMVSPLEAAVDSMLNGASHLNHPDMHIHPHRLSIHGDGSILTNGCGIPMPSGASHPHQSFHHASPAAMHSIAVSDSNQHLPFNCDSQLRQQHYQHLRATTPTSLFHLGGQSPFGNQHIVMPPGHGVANGIIGQYAAGHHINGDTGSSQYGHLQVGCGHSVNGDGDISDQMPSGPYEPELGMSENPHYFSTNKLLYEAHISRLQRILPDYQLHS